MRCSPWSTAWSCSHWRQVHRRGRPETVMASPGGARDLHGDPADAVSRCSRSRALDGFYGDFQALFGVSLEVAAGEVVAVIGANGAGKSDAAQAHRRRCMRLRAAMRSCSTASRSATCPRTRIVARGIALVPEGRRLFPSLIGRGEPVIGGQLGRPGPWTLAARLRPFPVLAERRTLPSTVALRRPAADGRRSAGR